MNKWSYLLVKFWVGCFHVMFDSGTKTFPVFLSAIVPKNSGMSESLRYVIVRLKKFLYLTRLRFCNIRTPDLEKKSTSVQQLEAVLMRHTHEWKIYNFGAGFWLLDLLPFFLGKHWTSKRQICQDFPSSFCCEWKHSCPFWRFFLGSNILKRRSLSTTRCVWVFLKPKH